MYGSYIADFRTHESTLHSMDIYEIGIPWLPEISCNLHENYYDSCVPRTSVDSSLYKVDTSGSINICTEDVMYCHIQHHTAISH